jgi:hypothetical protein
LKERLMASLGEMLNRVTRALVSSGVEESKAQEVAFHMADWKTDLDEWAGVWEDPERFNDEELTDIIYGFLVHVPNHVVAAKKLLELGPIEDVFGVGIFEEDD